MGQVGLLAVRWVLGAIGSQFGLYTPAVRVVDAQVRVQELIQGLRKE